LFIEEPLPEARPVKTGRAFFLPELLCMAVNIVILARASIPDYPPLVSASMIVFVITAFWLSNGGPKQR
jgi:hypothetical protein